MTNIQKITDADYRQSPITEEHWACDCADWLIPDGKALLDLRYELACAFTWFDYMETNPNTNNSRLLHEALGNLGVIIFEAARNAGLNQQQVGTHGDVQEMRKRFQEKARGQA